MAEKLSLSECTKVREELQRQLDARARAAGGLVDRWFAAPDAAGRLEAEREWAEATALLLGMPRLLAEATRRETVAFLEAKAAQVRALMGQAVPMTEALRLYQRTEVAPLEVRYRAHLEIEGDAAGDRRERCDSDACKAAQAELEEKRRTLAERAAALDAVLRRVDEVNDEIKTWVGREILIRPGVVDKTLHNGDWREGVARDIARRAREEAARVVRTAMGEGA